jgi:hypothetical protein
MLKYLILASTIIATRAFAHGSSHVIVKNWTISIASPITSVTIGNVKTVFSPPIPARAPGVGSAVNEIVGICFQTVTVTFGNSQSVTVPSIAANAFDSCDETEIDVLDQATEGVGYALRFDD